VPEKVLPPYLDALAEALPVGSDDVFLQTASLAFSASVRQVFSRSVLVRPWSSPTGNRPGFPAVAATSCTPEESPSGNTVPSVWQAAMSSFSDLGDRRAARKMGCARCGRNLRLILLMASHLHWKSVKTWRSRFGAETAIVNLYSPDRDRWDRLRLPDSRGLSPGE